MLSHKHMIKSDRALCLKHLMVLTIKRRKQYMFIVIIYILLTLWFEMFTLNLFWTVKIIFWLIILILLLLSLLVLLFLKTGWNIWNNNLTTKSTQKNKCICIYIYITLWSLLDYLMSYRKQRKEIKLILCKCESSCLTHTQSGDL